MPVDLWNHPKIPRLNAIEQRALSEPNSEGEWIDVNTTEVQKYSSFAGVNVQNLRRTGNADFQVRYNYLYLTCEKLLSGTEEEVLEDLLAANLTMFPRIPDNSTDSYRNYAKSRLQRINLESQLSMFIQMAYPSNDTNKFRNDSLTSGFELMKQPLSILYGALFEGHSNREGVFQVYTCIPRTVTVDAHISCESGNCMVTRLRHAPEPTILNLGSTCDSIYRIGCLTFGTYSIFPFMRYLPKALATVLEFAVTNPFDDWIAGNNVTYRGTLTGADESTRVLEYIRDETISDRLGIVLTSFWQGVAWGPQITRAGLFDRPQYPYQGLNTAAPERWVNTTEAVFSRPVPVYRADVGWIVTLLLITTTLLLLGIANVVISFLTIAPDLFYYASSMARENPYIDTPDGGTAMDGAERSRLLKDMRVQVADVSPENEVGYVVLKSVGDDQDFRTGRLKKDRRYW